MNFEGQFTPQTLNAAHAATVALDYPNHHRAIHLNPHSVPETFTPEVFGGPLSPDRLHQEDTLNVPLNSPTDLVISQKQDEDWVSSAHFESILAAYRREEWYRLASTAAANNLFTAEDKLLISRNSDRPEQRTDVSSEDDYDAVTDAEEEPQYRDNGVFYRLIEVAAKKRALFQVAHESPPLKSNLLSLRDVLALYHAHAQQHPADAADELIIPVISTNLLGLLAHTLAITSTNVFDREHIRTLHINLSTMEIRLYESKPWFNEHLTSSKAIQEICLRFYQDLKSDQEPQQAKRMISFEAVTLGVQDQINTSQCGPWTYLITGKLLKHGFIIPEQLALTNISAERNNIRERCNQWRASLGLAPFVEDDKVTFTGGVIGIVTGALESVGLGVARLATAVVEAHSPVAEEPLSEDAFIDLLQRIQAHIRNSEADTDIKIKVALHFLRIITAPPQDNSPYCVQYARLARELRSGDWQRFGENNQVKQIEREIAEDLSDNIKQRIVISTPR